MRCSRCGFEDPDKFPFCPECGLQRAAVPPSPQSPERFVATADRLVNGLLREAIGYRVERGVPYLRGIVGYMVEAPMLWIRYSRFPILVVAYDRRRPDILEDIVKQITIAGANEFFALLVVVPTRD